MMYLTIGDAYSGVLSSQVLDVAKRLRHIASVKIQVVIFISGRDFISQRKKILSDDPDAWVLPMFPGLQNWRFNLPLLLTAVILSGSRAMLCRGVIATNLGLILRRLGLVQKVGFDARGAYHAEWTEYQVVQHPRLIQEISDLEKQAIQTADYRLAVSQHLIQYWQETYSYVGQDHIQVPCSLSKAFMPPLPSEEVRRQLKNQHGLSAEDIIFVYSGSQAGWQSLEILDQIAFRLISNHDHIHLLLLAQVDLNNLSVYRAYPNRVSALWVKHDQVYNILSMCDYGLMIREQSVTNQVASPTKFAEYLAAGLEIIISPHLGDYSQMTKEQQWGYVWQDELISHPWQQLTEARKMYLHQQALQHFSKEVFDPMYQQLLDGLS
ncbi:MAG: hypothetical protein SF053_18805 [Bacteroidia bacterium]|nr:hypothetical protein [Bacteroidia bacterium]